MKVGITGQSGFIGTHLARSVMARADCEIVPFEDEFFAHPQELQAFVSSCDVIIHLAAASRMPSEEELYDLNVGLVRKLIAAMEAVKVHPLVMFSSSTHETRDTAYGRAKLEGRRLFEQWAERVGASFVGFVFPNIYGPGARVHYASFIANFAWEINHGIEPTLMVDAKLPLKYVGNLCDYIMGYFPYRGILRDEVPADIVLNVSDVLAIFEMFAKLRGEDALLLFPDNNIRNLYSTFKSYEG